MALNKKSALIFVAMLVTTGALASAAQAGTVTAGAYPATTSETQTSENVVSNGIRTVSCASITTTGTIAEGSETTEVTSEYANCTGNGKTTATITLNGCTFKRVNGTPVNGTGIWTTSIVCPPGKAIEIHIWATGKVHTETSLCTLHIPAQGPISAGQYHNRGGGFTPRFIEYTLLITNGLRIVRTAGTAVNCGPAETSNGSWSGSSDAIATNGSGEQVDLFVE